MLVVSFLELFVARALRDPILLCVQQGLEYLIDRPVFLAQTPSLGEAIQLDVLPEVFRFVRSALASRFNRHWSLQQTHDGSQSAGLRNAYVNQEAFEWFRKATATCLGGTSEVAKKSSGCTASSLNSFDSVRERPARKRLFSEDFAFVSLLS